MTVFSPGNWCFIKHLVEAANQVLLRHNFFFRCFNSSLQPTKTDNVIYHRKRVIITAKRPNAFFLSAKMNNPGQK